MRTAPELVDDRPGRGAARPGRAAVVALVFALLGLAISVYLTVEHYTANTVLACPESAAINCTKVTTSRWSVIAGVPVAVLGLAYFVVMTGLCLPPAWRRAWLGPLRLVAATAGVAMVVYLVYVELFDVDAICLWCTGVHVCTVVMFAAVLWATESRAARGLSG